MASCRRCCIKKVHVSFEFPQQRIGCCGGAHTGGWIPADGGSSPLPGTLRKPGPEAQFSPDLSARACKRPQGSAHMQQLQSLGTLGCVAAWSFVNSDTPTKNESPSSRIQEALAPRIQRSPNGYARMPGGKEVRASGVPAGNPLGGNPQHGRQQWVAPQMEKTAREARMSTMQRKSMRPAKGKGSSGYPGVCGKARSKV